MKAKKIEKKLTLNKATIVNLGEKELSEVKGGDFNTFLRCTARFLCTREYNCDSEIYC